MKRALLDMVVIITGASAGIGRALAVELGQHGARLALAARRLDRLEALNRELGGDHLCVAADVAQTPDCVRIVDETLRRFGRIDTLVCNAGYGFQAPVAQTTDEQMLAVFQTNVIGTLACIRAATPHMLKQEMRDGWRGQIMIVSSAVARRSLPFFGAYSATKAAQLSLAEAMRVEVSPRQICVTSVHPGGTQSEFGDVSASLSGGKRPGRIAGEIQQTSQEVARAMLRAIERPRPEVWPIALYRWATGLGTLMPRLVDRMMSSRRGQLSPGEPI
ncbi:MAG TPA: SDR family NAD(P)-dependent oxidoreductase [Tepidisphaeraceae bacterium]|nr:SDR family NAD(P)-dependent oxidoreductase [Tepidisphaeraceae bacterium]